jgi:hypothetical protein
MLAAWLVGHQAAERCHIETIKLYIIANAADKGPKTAYAKAFGKLSQLLSLHSVVLDGCRDE